MKKIFLIAALFGMALTSCVKDELTEQSYEQTQIVFEAPVVSPTTKVNEVGVNYENGSSFGVWGFYYAGDVYTTFDSGVEYMPGNSTQNTTKGGIEISNNGGVWKNSSNNYYWPKNGTLTFIAYAPYSVNEYVSVDGNGITFEDYIVTGDNQENKDIASVDLLYSERAYNKKANDNTGSSGVDINFKHALSSIRFTVSSAQDYGKTKIEVTRITLSNVVCKGTFNQSLTDANNEFTSEIILPGTTDEQGNTSTDYKNFLWTPDYSVSASYSPTIHSDVTSLTTTPVYIINGKSDITEVSNLSDLILLPQNLKNDTNNKEVTLTVYYTITSPGGTSIEQESSISLADNWGYDHENRKSRTISAWERGKRYTYRISVGLDEISFHPTVSSWTDISIGGGI